MPTLLLCTLCDDVRIEQSGKHMLIGLFDRFTVGDFARTLPNFHVFAKIGVDDEGQYPVSVRLASHEGDFDVELQGQLNARLRSEATDLFEAVLDLCVTGLRVPRPGRYHVRLTVDGRELGGCAFVVDAAVPPTVQ
jgi:hypothetical protein